MVIFANLQVTPTFRKETNKFFIPTKIEIKSLYNLKEVNDEIKKLLSEKEFLIDDINKQIEQLKEHSRLEPEKSNNFLNMVDKMHLKIETTLHSFNLADVDKQKLEKIFSLKKRDFIGVTCKLANITTIYVELNFKKPFQTL